MFRAGKPLDAAQTKALKAAIDKLDQLGVVAITGDCGAFVHYQVEARKMTATPMVLSPLMQAPMLAAMYAGTRLEHSGRPRSTSSPTAPPATAGTWRRRRSW